MVERQKIRIFVSSPADVRPERLIAERMIRRLAREFSYHFLVEPVLWEREPLTAGAHFQDNIVPPRETDLVVCILWSRLGVTLPAEKFQGALSGGPVTGTEWEFEDALDGFRKVKRPDLLLYRKTAPLSADLGDDAVLDEARRQRRLVEDFMVRWTRNAEGGFAAAFWEFDGSANFEDLLESHLRELLRRRLRGLTADGERVEGEVRWHLPPYRGLLAFEPEHAGVFFGRTRARNELRELLHRQVTRNKAFVLVMGASGSGKSSLVKAGLLPDLKLPGMIGRVALTRHLIVKPSEGGAEPLGALLGALAGPAALPEIAGLGLVPRADTLVETVRFGLEAAARKEGLLDGAEARLLVVVDQLEELFTQERTGDAARDRFIAALEALATSGIAWVVATMRADFFDALGKAPRLAALSEGEARYLLLPPGDSEIGEIIRLPALEAGLRFEARGETGDALDETIRSAALRAPGALPLLSFLLDQLWQDRTAEGLLTFASYERLGGLEGALARRAEAVFAGLSPDLQAAFPALLRQLVTAGQDGHGGATSRPTAQAEAGRTPVAAALIRNLAEARLLVVEGEVVRLAHEALLTHWPRAADQIAHDRDDIERRARIEQAAITWAARGRDATLLLQRGLALSEAEDLLARRAAELPEALAGYIRTSSEIARAAERRRLRRLRLTASVLAVLAAGAGVGAWFGFTGQAEAERQAVIAEQNAAEADRRRIDAQSATSRGLTEKARLALEAGQTDLATGLLAEALPRPGETPPRPLVPEAVAAARAALTEDPWLADLDLGGEVGARALSPDGRLLVATDAGPRLLFIDTDSGREISPAVAEGGPVYALRFDRAGQRLLVAAGEAGPTLRDRQGKVIARFDQPAGMTAEISFDEAERRVIAGAFSGGITVWDAKGGAPLATLPVESNITALDTRGGIAAAVTGDGTALALDLATGRELWRTRVAEEELTTAVLSPDGSFVAVGSITESARILDARTGAVLLTVEAGNGANVAFRGANEFLVFGVDTRIFYWHEDQWRQRDTVIMGLDDVTAAVWFEQAGVAVIARHERGLEVWSLDTFTRLRRADLGTDQAQWDRLIMAADGSRGVAVGRDGRNALLDMTSLLPARSLEVAQPGTLDTLVKGAVTGDGKTLFVSKAGTGIRAVDLATGAIGPRLAASADDLMAVVSDAAGGTLAALNIDTRRVDLIDVGKDVLIRSIAVTDPDYGRDRDLGGIALSPDGRTLALLWWDGGLLVEVASGKVLAPLATRNQTGGVMAFTPDGRQLVIAHGDGTATRVNTGDGKVLGTIHGIPQGPTTIAVAPDGRSALVGSFDGRLTTLDLTRDITGREIGLGGSQNDVETIRYRADGALALVAAGRGNLLLADPATGAILARRQTPANAVAFDPAGGALISLGRQLRWWPVDPLALAPAGDIAGLTLVAGRRGLRAEERIAAFIDPPPGPADPDMPPATRCDRDAGDPFDPARNGPGAIVPREVPPPAATNSDDPVARACHQAATAARDEVRFTYLEGLAFLRIGVRGKALPLIDAAVAKGYPAALVTRARIHLENSTESRRAAALPLLEQALAAGNGEAAAELGLIAWNGLIGPADPLRAVDYFNRGAALGSGRAAMMLAIAFETGRGVAAASLTDAFRHAVRAGLLLERLGPGAAIERDQAQARRARLLRALRLSGPDGAARALAISREVQEADAGS